MSDFVDRVTVHVKGGDGGNGSAGIRREKYKPLAGPNGGNGGDGGSVIFMADSNANSLLDYRFMPHREAESGTMGLGDTKDGSKGADLILPVPVGTVVFEAKGPQGKPKHPGEQLADLRHAGDKFVVAAGGNGGLGNAALANRTRRAPGFALLGEPGEERDVILELKSIADVALVGFPSAGKSSLIAAMSSAKPKIADYPFTTLVPNLGVARSGDLSFVVADLPGLIEGAHEGRGLGHEFLRHIERTALIVHVVDLTGDWEGRDPLDDYKIINNELALYADELAARPRIVVANKIDVAGTEEALERLKAQVKADSIAAAGGNEFAPSPIDPKVYCISALTGEGVDSLKAAIANQVHELREQARQAEASDVQYEHVWELKREARDKRFTVRKLSEGVFRVVGTQVERMVVQCDWENEEAVVFLQHRLKRVGVEEALEKAGAVDGDEIRICGRAFEFESTRTAADLFEELDI